MHRTSGKVSMPLAALLAFSVLALIVPVSASTGNILIETTTPPSPHVSVRMDDNMSLYFGDVAWSGGLLELYLSTDGYSYVSKDDIAYGPVFSVASIKVTAINTTAYPGYSVGRDWINGTIPAALEIPGGDYYVKAFDGSTSAVAVTDNYITIEASLEVTPSYGPGQASIELKGYGLPANGYANLSYRVQGAPDWTTIKELVQANATGRFAYPMTVPDLRLALPSGEQNETHTPITFRMTVNGTGQTETGTFDEYWRGLKLVEGEIKASAEDGKLYGNLTDFHSLAGVYVKVQGSLSIKGKWFHPGRVTILWNGTKILGSATADEEGHFKAKIEVPITSKGLHYVVIDDGKTVFLFAVNVAPTLILVPDEGPVGTSVDAYGYGFPASDDTIYNVTIWWESIDICRDQDELLTWVLTNADGRFEAFFEVPHTYGGPHNVTATTDGTDPTAAKNLFNVKPSLWVDPSTGYNNGTVMNVHGAGLEPSDRPYFWYIDSTLFAGEDESFHPDCNGDIHFQFICSGFSCSGLHTVFAIRGGPEEPQSTGYTYEIETYASFTVVREEEMQDEINAIMTDVETIKEEIVNIEGDTAIIGIYLEALEGRIVEVEGDIATVKTDLGTIKVNISDMRNDASTIISATSDARAAAEAARSEASGVWVLSLTAAIASAATLIITVIVIVLEIFGSPAE